MFAVQSPAFHITTAATEVFTRVMVPDFEGFPDSLLFLLKALHMGWRANIGS